MTDAEGPAHSTLVNDMGKVVEFYPLVPALYHVVHVDNLGVAALEQEKVTDIMAELEQLLSGGGLALHEVSVGSGRQEVSGNSIACFTTNNFVDIQTFSPLLQIHISSVTP